MRARSALMKVPGVRKADVSLEKGEAIVTYEQGNVITSQLVDAVTKAGYRASVKKEVNNR
ncbi:MAG: heavy-metal-associated domain-containing protein [Candidatus Poribacteria bacterium]